MSSPLPDAFPIVSKELKQKKKLNGQMDRDTCIRYDTKLYLENCSKCSISHHENVAADSRCPFFSLRFYVNRVSFSHTCQITPSRISPIICICARNRLGSVNIVKWLTLSPMIVSRSFFPFSFFLLYDSVGCWVFFHFELAEIEISYFALCVDTLMETKLFTIEIQFNC